MIEIYNLNKSFGRLQVLKNVQIHFDKGKIISILGPNGSGKTTLIKCILGMVLADSGDIKIKGHSTLNDHLYRSQIGYMPQIGRYPDNMLMEHLFEMMMDLRQNDTYSNDEELIERYNLRSIFDKPMRTLSGGTRQKVSACLAFLFNPDCLILDEPTAGLDPLSAEVLKDKILKAKAAGKTVLITSHIMSEVDELADEIMYMQDGKILFHHSVDEIKNQTKEERLGKALSEYILKYIN